MLDRWDVLASEILSGRSIDREEALAVLHAADDDLLALLSASFRIRRQHFGTVVKLNYLVNAKSGDCEEDCGYCSQSVHADTDVEQYALLSVGGIVAGAEQAVSNHATTCCIVTSGRGPHSDDVDRVAAATREIKRRHPDLKICACLGFLDAEQATTLRDAGVDRYNHNLNTSAERHESVCTTHSFDDRVATVGEVKKAGLSPCSGLIVGMGETMEDIVDVAFALKEMGVDSIPVNFLVPIAGTRLQSASRDLHPRFCLRVLCMMRFVCPDKEIRVSAGREEHLRSLQPMSLYPANSLFIADYLTTEGQASHLDWSMIEDLGFTIERMTASSPPSAAQPVSHDDQ
ncbi:MAG: biotin synthase BioB [Phycisphaerales bacterium]|nr:biotin synthase BioB [Phycisphaerales bacterium]